MNKKRLGKLHIQESILSEYWEKNRLKFVPTKCEFDYNTRVFKYVGYSPHFDVLKDGYIIPQYMPTFKRDKIGRVKLVSVDKI